MLNRNFTDVGFPWATRHSVAWTGFQNNEPSLIKASGRYDPTVVSWFGGALSDTRFISLVLEQF